MTYETPQASKDAAAVLETDAGKRLFDWLIGQYMAAPPRDGADGLTYARHAGRADVVQHIATLAATGRAGGQAPARPLLMRRLSSLFQKTKETHHDG